ncbi:Hypothetical predicted protein [Pelobates cultripes]|uniref:Uncharacterized protein n=1 Tax=Pelobates cultripes TaxID=61616 RepID=A0AAD1VTF0_PELCU|nr:Hypothetical predicted protein [Pelobates cultripes]
MATTRLPTYGLMETNEQRLDEDLSIQRLEPQTAEPDLLGSLDNTISRLDQAFQRFWRWLEARMSAPQAWHLGRKSGDGGRRRPEPPQSKVTPQAAVRPDHTLPQRKLTKTKMVRPRKRISNSHLKLQQCARPLKAYMPTKPLGNPGGGHAAQQPGLTHIKRQVSHCRQREKLARGYPRQNSNHRADGERQGRTSIHTEGLNTPPPPPIIRCTFTQGLASLGQPPCSSRRDLDSSCHMHRDCIQHPIGIG